jgi:hypothetical protein
MSTAPTTPNIPSAPSHLSPKAQKQWSKTYANAFAAAANDFPNDVSRQRQAALKAANQILAVPAPASAADIENLEDWQVLLRGTRNGETFCVTSDGKKYSFPVKA